MRAVKRVRIDSLLSQRKMFSSRSQAAASVMAGDVLLGPGRRRASKPGELVREDVELEVVQGAPFVSRGGVKLANALSALDLEVSARNEDGFPDTTVRNVTENSRVLDFDEGAGFEQA